MKNTVLILIILTSLSVFGQQSKIDSLKIVLEKNTTKEKKLLTLKLLSKELINYGTVDNSLEYYKQMLSLSKELKNHKLESLSCRYLSESYMKKEDSIKAIYYVNKSLRLNDSIKTDEYYLKDINQLGRVYHHFQRYNKAIDIYKNGLNNYNNIHSKDVIATIYGNIGNAYSQLGNKDKAIDYYLIQARTADKYEIIQQKSNAYYNIAWVYMNLDQYEKAEKYYFKALKDSAKFTLTTYINRNHHGLAINYSRWGKYKKALSHNKIALKYYRETGNKLYEFDVLNNIAVVYSRMKEPNNTLIFAEKALNVANSINHKLAIYGAKNTMINAYINLKQFNLAEKKLIDLAKDTLINKTINLIGKAGIYEGFYLINKGKYNYKKSLTFLEKLKTLNDSILKEQRDSKITEVETKYQTEKKEKNLLLKKEELQSQKIKTQRLYIYLGLVSLLGLLILGIFIFSKKQNKIAKIELNQEINSLKQKVFDFKEQTLKKENEFRKFLMKKYNFKIQHIETWEGIIDGFGRKEYAEKMNISENTIKTWRSELFNALKKASNTNSRFSDVKAYKVYRNNLKHFNPNPQNKD